jgi:hypothetical protein
MTTSHTPPDVAAPVQATPLPYVNRGDLPYDYEDLGLNLEEMQSKFSDIGEHVHHTRGLWQAAVDKETTKPDYWAWVLLEIAKDDDDY